MNTKIRLYIFVALLFVLTFLLASRVITGIKTHNFDYLKIGVNACLLFYAISQIIRLGKAENDKTE